MKTPFYVKTLTHDLDQWIKEGWVPASSRASILTHVKAQNAGPNFVGVLAILGVVLLGFAAISFVASNWALMGKLLRFGVILAAMWSAFGIAAFALHRKVMVYAHSFGLLGAGLFGASIMLVAQTFNIQAHYPTGILIWCLGTLAVSVVIHSRPVLIFASLLAGLWMFLSFTGPIADHLQTWAYPLLSFVILILALRMNTQTVLHVLAISWLVFLPNLLIYQYGDNGYVQGSLLSLTGGSYLAVALLARLGSGQFGSSIFVNWMALAALFVAYVLQFSVDVDVWNNANTIKWLIPHEVFLALLILTLTTWFVRLKTMTFPMAAGIVAGALILLFLPFIIEVLGETGTQMLYGAIFFGVCVLLLMRGLALHSRDLMWIGGIGFTAQAFYVYFETFKDLLNTSLFFLVGGVLLLGLSFMALRLNKQISAPVEVKS